MTLKAKREALEIGLAWVVEIGPVSYPDSLFASCGRLPYLYADRSRHVWNPSPSLTDDARVRHACNGIFSVYGSQRYFRIRRTCSAE